MLCARRYEFMWMGEYLPRHYHPLNAPEPPQSGVSGSAAENPEDSGGLVALAQQRDCYADPD